MDSRAAASLRAIAAAVTNAVQTVKEALESDEENDDLWHAELREAVQGARRSLGRGTAQVASLEREWAPHARVVRMGRRAVERAETALSAVLDAALAEEQVVRLAYLAAALAGAERAAKAILLETDGPAAFRAVG